MIWVIDTSALIRLFVPDGPLPNNIEASLNSAATGADLVLAPQLLLAEAGNVLLRKQRRNELSADETLEIVGAIQSLPIRYFGHEDLISQALAHASNYGLTVYDALYIALAEHHGASLITCDEKLHAIAKRIGLA